MAKAKQAKKKYQPEILNTFKYRGFRVREIFNRKTRRREFKCRFQINNREFYLTQETRRALEEMIDEIIYQERRAARDLPTPQPGPTLKELFDRYEPKITKDHQRTLFRRVTRAFLSLLPDSLRVAELKQAHFQQYIDLRRANRSKHTKKPVLDETIDKELYAVSAALRAAPRLFPELEDYKKPVIPKAAAGGRRRRARLVSKESELDRLLAELRRPREGKQTFFHEARRRRLADDLEFRFETGLRRKEVARLKKHQYRPDERALREVIRWKTGTLTAFFPLSCRAAEIIEARIAQNPNSEYIFTTDGEPLASDYRALKKACQTLGIAYGRYTDHGFIPHDLRHNFATEIIQVTDIETAKSLTGHTGNEIFTYLHTNEKLQREAINRRERRDQTKEIIGIYKEVRRGKMKAKQFVAEIKKMLQK